MSDRTNINNNSQVFQNIKMAERQPSTNTTLNNPKLAIDNGLIIPNRPITINNITMPQNQQFINIPLLQPQPLIFPAPPPPAAFQIQPSIINPNIQPKLNPSAPTFTPNPFTNINTPVQGYNNNNNNNKNNITNQIELLRQESLGKLQILSIQLNTLQLINQQNPTIESLNQYQTVYQQYNNEFTNTLLINQYINNLNNLAINAQTNDIVADINKKQSNINNNNNNNNNVTQLETIEEGENESEEEIIDSIAPAVVEGINGNKVTTKQIIGEQSNSNYSLTNNNANSTMSTQQFGEPQIDNKRSELEKIKKQIRCILNKITGENFEKLSFEIASILKVSDIAASELPVNVSGDELFKLQKAQFKALIKLILKCILEKAINETLFSNQYGRLCYSLYLYAENNEFKKKLFRQQLLSICHSIFKKTRLNGENDKFIGIITMIGELFKFGLVSWNVIYSGIFEQLLPPINSIDILGICKLLKIAGSDFDRHHYKDINNIINQLGKYSSKFDFRTQCFVKDITEMRRNDWKQKQEVEKNKNKNKPSQQTQQRVVYNNQNKNKKKYYNNNNNRGGRWRNNNNNRYGNSYNSYNNRKRQRNFRPTVEFVKDITLQDRSHYTPNKVLTKTWAMRNSGEMSWGDNVELVYFKGDKTLSLEDRYPVINALPGQEVQISATVKTPRAPGRYCTYFRLQKNGKFFGPRVWVDIIVSLNNLSPQTSIETRQNCATNTEAYNNKILSCQ